MRGAGMGRIPRALSVEVIPGKVCRYPARPPGPAVDRSIVPVGRREHVLRWPIRAGGAPNTRAVTASPCRRRTGVRFPGPQGAWPGRPHRSREVGGQRAGDQRCRACRRPLHGFPRAPEWLLDSASHRRLSPAAGRGPVLSTSLSPSGRGLHIVATLSSGRGVNPSVTARRCGRPSTCGRHRTSGAGGRVPPPGLRHGSPPHATVTSLSAGVPRRRHRTPGKACVAVRAGPP